MQSIGETELGVAGNPGKVLDLRFILVEFEHYEKLG